MHARVRLYAHVGKPQTSRILRETRANLLARSRSSLPFSFSLARPSPRPFSLAVSPAGVGFVCAHESEYIRRTTMLLYHKGTTNHRSAISPPLGGGGSADLQDVDAMSAFRQRASPYHPPVLRRLARLSRETRRHPRRVTIFPIFLQLDGSRLSLGVIASRKLSPAGRNTEFDSHGRSRRRRQ